MGTGARAKPDYWGLGVIDQVQQASLRAARTNFPQIKFEVRVAADSSFFDQYTKPTPKGWKIIYKRVSIHLHLSVYLWTNFPFLTETQTYFHSLIVLLLSIYRPHCFFFKYSIDNFSFLLERQTKYYFVKLRLIHSKPR